MDNADMSEKVEAKFYDWFGSKAAKMQSCSDREMIVAFRAFRAAWAACREECAKVCEEIQQNREDRADPGYCPEENTNFWFWSGQAEGAEDCAEAIRGL